MEMCYVAQVGVGTATHPTTQFQAGNNRTPMNTIRKERFSVSVSFSVAALAFPIVLLLAGLMVALFLGILLEILDPSGPLPADPYGKIVAGILIAIVIGVPVLVAYLVSRAIYLSVRWENVDNTLGRYCYNCSYDLTGNVSGICPECGTAVPPAARLSADAYQNPSRK